MSIQRLSVSALLLVPALMLLWVPSAAAAPPDWDWSWNGGGSAHDHARAIAVDASGNSYVTGYYRNSATIGGISLTSAGDEDVFVAKSDSSGTVLWATSYGGAGDDGGHGIAVDREGNVLVAGRYNASATFGSTTLTSAGSADVFVAKLDTNGSLLWAVSLGGPSAELGRAIDVDGSGNSYLTGSYQGAASFGTTTLTSVGGSDVYVAKLDSDGSVLWATSAGSPGGSLAVDRGHGIAVDSAQNSYATGIFSGTAAFGSTTLTSAGAYDIFIAKLDSTGSILWATSAGGTGYDYGNAIDVDALGNSHVAGSFSASATFGTTTLTSAGGLDGYVAKVNGSGSFLWVTPFGGADSEETHGLAVDWSGDSYASGSFDVSCNIGGTTLTSNGNTDVFVTKLDGGGPVLWAVSAGGTRYDQGFAIAVDGAKNGYVTGAFGAVMQVGTTTLTPYGSDDAFVAKLGKNSGDANVGGWFFHDETGSGFYQPGASGVAGGLAAAPGSAATSSTSGWYQLRMLDPSVQQVLGAPPSGSWWTLTSPESCTVDLGLPGATGRCDYGLWWGLDNPETGFEAVADATVHHWLAGPQGGDSLLHLRQPGVGSALVKFDVSGLPSGTNITSAGLELCMVDASNDNRAYMTVYPVLEPWDEATVVWPEPAYGAPVGWDYLPKRRSPGQGTLCAMFDLDPTVVQEWLADPASNHGLIVRAEGVPREVGQSYASREHQWQGLRPQLVVGYGP